MTDSLLNVVGLSNDTQFIVSGHFMAVDLAMDFQICQPPCAFGLSLYNSCDGCRVTVLVRQGADLSSAASHLYENLNQTEYNQ